MTFAGVFSILSTTMGKTKNIYIVVVVVIIAIFTLEFLNLRKPKHPDAGLNPVELVEKYRYTIETHEILTEDGYIITLFRIPPKNPHNKGIPIFFMHGLMHSGVDFIVLGPNKALALLLVDLGYDIWLGNARGTTFSRKHQTLDPDKDNKFWDFSLHEIGVIDISNSIDYILNVTGYESLHYVGFSQGTIAFFILTSERPEYAQKIKLITAMAPAIFIKNPRSFALAMFAFFRDAIENFFWFFNMREFFANNSLLGIYMKTICNENSMFVHLCLFHIFNVQGFNYEGTNKTTLTAIYTNTPAGMGSKQLVHVLQLMGTGSFKQFDLGKRRNLEKYGQETPPKYDLTKATTPVALYYTANDWSVNIKNIPEVEKSLPNVVKSYLVPMENFNHDDFVHSDDAPRVVYESIIEEILKYH